MPKNPFSPPSGPATRSSNGLHPKSKFTGFNAANWTINTAGFTDPDTGTWALAQSGNSLVFSYTASIGERQSASQRWWPFGPLRNAENSATT